MLASSLTGSGLAAGLGTECCLDLEQRIEELEAAVVRRGTRKVELKISGVVNRAVLFWNDGFQRDAYIVDPTVDNSSFKFEGEAKLRDGLKVGFLLKIDAYIAASEEVDQLNPLGEGQTFKTDRSFVYVEHDRTGRLALGRQNSASRGIDNIELTGAETTDAEIPDWMGAFFLRTRSGELLSDLTWGDFVLGKFAGVKGEFVTYTSPTLQGFQASAAWGENDYWDAALRYRAEWNKTFRIRAGVGYFSNTEEKRPENLRDTGWGGSVAALHIPSGINIAYNHGRMKHTDRCNERGEVSGACRGADVFHYVRGGILQKYFEIGPTALYGERYWGNSHNRDSGADLVGALALDPVLTPTELSASQASVWGFGITQRIDAAAMHLYAGYRHHELEVDLVTAAGRVADKGLKPFDLIFTGVRIEF